MGEKKRVFIFFFTLLYLGLFFWRFKRIKPRVFSPGAQVEMVVVLDNEPGISGQSQRFKAGGLRIKTGRYPEYHYGDRLKIRGTVGDHQSMSFPIISKLEAGQGSWFKRLLLGWRQRLEEVIKENLPSPQSSLLIGMLLGIKTLPGELSSDLKRSGLIHIVVASGSNVSLVGSFFLYFSGLIQRRKALFLSIGAIFFYTLMVGAEPPIVRASLMGGLSYWAKLFGRQAYQLITLILVVGFMLLVNPFYIFDLSFQLSFLATAGIILFAPLGLRLFRRMGRGLASAMATTVSAQLFVTPLIVSQFGEFPVFSLLTNVLVYPVIEPVMILGFPFAVLGMISPIISRLLSPFLWLALTYFIGISRFFGSLELGMLEISKLPFVIFLPYYLLLVYFWFRFQDGGE